MSGCGTSVRLAAEASRLLECGGCERQASALPQAVLQHHLELCAQTDHPAGRRGRTGWSLNTPRRRPGTHRPLVFTSHKTPAGFCSGSVSLVELVCDEDSAAPSFTLTNYENEVNKTMRVAQEVVFYSFGFIRLSIAVLWPRQEHV